MGAPELMRDGSLLAIPIEPTKLISKTEASREAGAAPASDDASLPSFMRSKLSRSKEDRLREAEAKRLE
eukprot:6324133-Prymnesium_polylepis.1